MSNNSNNNSFGERSVELHRKLHGKIELKSKIPVLTRDDLSLAYTPGVAQPCLEINKNPEEVWNLTLKSHTVAVVTDGSAVLGLGNIGAAASIPVMEGKAVLFKELAGIDAFPIALNTQNVDEIVAAVKAIAPVFGGINLEDISAPRCFEVEEALRAELDIPVMHDDQHGTAMAVLAGLLNALKVTGKSISTVNIIINGAGAAGIAVAKLLLTAGCQHISVVDTKGMIAAGRPDMNEHKTKLAEIINPEAHTGSLAEALVGTDVFIGLSKPGLLTGEMVKTMAPQAIIFAMANPTPEIMPDEALAAGAVVVATGRSDFPNQVNNALIFPGIFKGALQVRLRDFTPELKVAVAQAVANMIPNPTAEHILPSPLDREVASTVAQAVITFARK
ncbi:MAG: NADP-dependent malic enzyme [Patescibacteria group bacterium]